jgi:hypothetical protein
MQYGSVTEYIGLLEAARKDQDPGSGCVDIIRVHSDMTVPTQSNY